MTHYANPSPASRTFTGGHMLGILLAFFATVLIANMTMVYFASHSWTGLVVKNAYVASQEFNAVTARREQAATGISFTLHYERPNLTLALMRSDGTAVAAAQVTVVLGRPSQEGEDQVMTLLPRGNGIFSTVTTLGPGQWSGEARADIDGHGPWLRPLRILVRD